MVLDFHGTENHDHTCMQIPLREKFMPQASLANCQSITDDFNWLTRYNSGTTYSKYANTSSAHLIDTSSIIVLHDNLGIGRCKHKWTPRCCLCAVLWPLLLPMDKQSSQSGHIYHYPECMASRVCSLECTYRRLG
jgi:hypothetical protein